MTNTTSLFFFLMSMFSICKNLSAQIPDNFEFLQHQFSNSNPGVVKIYEDEIYYVSNNATSPMTTVNRLTADKEIEVLFELPYWFAQSKLFQDSENSFQIVLYSFVDYDIGAPGFAVVNVEDSQVSIDTIVSYNFDGSQQTGVLGDRYLFINNIVKDQSGNWLTIDRDTIYQINSTGIVSTNYKEGWHSLYDVFTNENEQIFSFTHNHTDGQSTLLELVDNQLDTVLTVPSSNIVRNLLNTNHGNYVKTSDEILLYSIDFGSLLNRWSLTEYLGDIKYFIDEGATVEFLTTTDSLFYVYEIDEDRKLELKAQQELNDNEILYSFHKLDHIQYLFSGQYNLENITRQVFFRNINSTDKHAVSYPSVVVALTDMELIQTEIDTIHTFVDSSGDTIHRVQFGYDLSLTFENNGSETVNIANAFSDDSAFFGFFFDRLISTEVYDINPGDQLEHKVFFYNRDNQITTLRIGCPGGNYMFNKRDFIYFL